MKNNLLKKVLVLGIISILILTCCNSVIGYTINTLKSEIIESDYDINHPRNPIFSYNYSEYGILDDSDLPEALGGPDLAIIKFLGWWSPAPWWVGISYICYSYSYGNLGTSYNGQGTLDLYVYLIYEDEEVLQGGHHMESDVWIRGWHGTDSWALAYYDELKPLKMRLELHTSLPDSRQINNVKTVTVNLGVTIEGEVYEKDLSGNRRPVQEAIMKCNSDILITTMLTGYTMSEENGYYCLWSPKKLGAPAFKYTVRAIVSEALNHEYNRIQSKKTNSLNGYDYAEINFEFLNLKSKNINFGSSQSLTIFSRFFDMFPILQRILDLMR
jgi:hypothetical protein